VDPLNYKNANYYSGIGMNWTRTSYLFLVMILISVGVTSAYAVTITLGADPVVVQGDLNVDGDIDVSGQLTNDNDAICFDDGSQCLRWVDGSSRFNIGELFINGGFEAEGTSTFQGLLNVDGDLDLSGQLTNDNDIIRFDDGNQLLQWVDGQNQFAFSSPLDVLGLLTVTEGSLNVVSGNAIIGGDLDLTGFSATDDDTIFFDGGTTTFLRWDELPFGEFVFSDNVFIDGLLDVESLNDFPLGLNRIGSDGPMIVFARDDIDKGDISIAGEIVSINAFTGSHYAWTTQEPQRGMVVSMNGQNKYLHDNPEAEILYGVDITTKKNDPAVLGTFLILHEPLSASGLVNPLLVMAEGNGEVWVADMGVDIQPGDYLISSSVAGHAMKDDRSEKLSHIIGRAAEPIDWSEVNETIDGVKHKKISILFNFVPLNNNIVE